MRSIDYFSILAIALVLFSTTAFGIVSHPAAEITNGTFGEIFGGGDYKFKGDVGIISYGERVLTIGNTESGGRQYALVSAGCVGPLCSGGIGLGKFSIYDKSAGISRLTIDNSGNVGINTIRPMQTLSVAGTLNVTSQPTSGSDLIVTSSGNVGIGTSNPVNKLTVLGSVTAFGSLNATSINATFINATQIKVASNVFADDIWIARIGMWASEIGGESIGPGNLGDTLRYDGTDWIPNSFLFNDGSRMGISTINPFSTLTVAGSVTALGSLNASSINATSIRTNTLNATFINATKITVRDINASNINASKIVVDTNVGIGTDNPARQLDVNGPIRLRPSSTPINPQNGDIYFDATFNVLRCYRNGQWIDCSNDPNVKCIVADTYWGSRKSSILYSSAYKGRSTYVIYDENSPTDYKPRGIGKLDMLINGRNICKDANGCTYRIWRYSLSGSIFSPTITPRYEYKDYPSLFRQFLNNQYLDAIGNNVGKNGDGTTNGIITWNVGDPPVTIFKLYDDLTVAKYFGDDVLDPNKVSDPTSRESVMYENDPDMLTFIDPSPVTEYNDFTVSGDFFIISLCDD